MSSDGEYLFAKTDGNTLLAFSMPDLILLGQTSAFDVLKTAASERNFFSDVVAVLPGLNWEEKEAIFDLVAAAASTRDERYLLADSLAEARDTRAPAKIWGLLAAEDADARLVAELRDPLKQSYFSEYHYSFTDAESHEQKRLKAQCHAMARNGTVWQKTVALSLLSMADRPGKRDMTDSSLKLSPT